MKAKRTKRPLPAEADMPILRKAAASCIIVTMIDGRPRHNYSDGASVSLRERHLAGETVARTGYFARSERVLPALRESNNPEAGK